MDGVTLYEQVNDRLEVVINPTFTLIAGEEPATKSFIFVAGKNPILNLQARVVANGRVVVAGDIKKDWTIVAQRLAAGEKSRPVTVIVNVPEGDAEILYFQVDVTYLKVPTGRRL